MSRLTGSINLLIITGLLFIIIDLFTWVSGSNPLHIERINLKLLLTLLDGSEDYIN